MDDALPHAARGARRRHRRGPRRAGLRPWLVVAAAGTTDTGAVDPLDAIADVAAREGCWFHVDAAYGGFFLLTEHGRGAAARASSGPTRSVLDPHKTLFLPYGSGIVVRARRRPVLAAHTRLPGTTCRTRCGSRARSRRPTSRPSCRSTSAALRMWLPLVLLGHRPFRAALEEKLLLARYFRAEVAAAGFEVGPEPDLSIVTYRWAPPGARRRRPNRLNQAIVDGARRDGRVFLSSTHARRTVHARAWRAVSFRTHRRTIDLAVRVLREQVAALG